MVTFTTIFDVNKSVSYMPMLETNLYRMMSLFCNGLNRPLFKLVSRRPNKNASKRFYLFFISQHYRITRILFSHQTLNMNKAKLLTKMETSTTMTPTGQIHKRLKTGTYKRIGHTIYTNFFKHDPLDHIQLPLQLPTPIATPKPEPQPPAEEDDTMFGDDLALEELDLTAIIEKKKYQDMISITPKEDMTINDSFDDLPLDELGDVLMKAEKNVQQQPTVATNVNVEPIMADFNFNC